MATTGRKRTRWHVSQQRCSSAGRRRPGNKYRPVNRRHCFRVQNRKLMGGQTSPRICCYTSRRTLVLILTLRSIWLNALLGTLTGWKSLRSIGRVRNTHNLHVKEGKQKLPRCFPAVHDANHHHSQYSPFRCVRVRIKEPNMSKHTVEPISMVTCPDTPQLTEVWINVYEWHPGSRAGTGVRGQTGNPSGCVYVDQQEL